jgi:hypothetical protein
VLWLAAAAATATAAPPPNDNFADAQVLSGQLPLDVAGTTVEATREVGEPVAAEATPSGHSIWFRWEATSTGYVSIGDCGSEERVNLAIYTGGTLGALSEVASTRYGNAPDCVWNERNVIFTAHAGTVYSIAVEGDGLTNEYLPPQSGEAPIELHLSDPTPPANDDFVDAEAIEPREIAYDAENFGATAEPGEPDHRGEAGGASVWFKWTASRSGGAFLQACPEEIGKEGVVAVYTGSAVASLTPVPAIEPSQMGCDYLFSAIAGVTYRIALDGVLDPASGGAEMFSTEVSLRYVPRNDEFEDATDLGDPTTGKFPSSAGWIGFSNVGATKQPGEPDHAGNGGGASVWFRWTAPLTGSVQMTTCQAAFPTLLAAYTGSSVSGLTSVASGSGVESGGCLTEGKGTGEIGFNVDAGTTYYVAVDGRDGATGSFGLRLWTTDERLKPPAEPTPTPKRPTATITHRHIDPRRGMAAFTLRSDVTGATFRCKLDRHGFSRCGKRAVYRHLRPGRHRFVAEAVGPTGLVGERVAKAAFVIDTPRQDRRADHH